MQIIETIKDMQSLGRRLRAEGRSIGFVPTMGALHEGHLSLVRRSKQENAVTVVSIFVNPTQFGPDEDFSEYPRDTENDIRKLSELEVEVIFLPMHDEMYPDGFSSFVNTGRTGQVLCGVSRPGHFNGVATVVVKLFHIVMPDRAYFGQKDFQQTVIVRQVANDFNIDVEVIVCPTIRESDGLAMSSRNAYLRGVERKAARILYRALKHGEELILSRGADDPSSVKKEMQRLIESETLATIDYIDIVHPDDLASLRDIIIPVVLCLAVKIGKTRLIDNIMVESGQLSTIRF